MQDYPGAPGSARQRNPGTDGPAACGGAAVPLPQAWDHVRSRAVPTPLPLPSPLVPPGHAGPAGADRSVPPTTALVPAHASRLLQDVLRRVAATPRTLTYPVHPAPPVPTRPPPATAGTGFPRQHHPRAPPASATRRPPAAAGGPQGGYHPRSARVRCSTG